MKTKPLPLSLRRASSGDGPGGKFDDAFHVSLLEEDLELEDGKTETVRAINIYIFGPIKDTDQFIPALEALNAVGEGDTINIYLNTPGGSVEATDTFLHHLGDNLAAVNWYASGGCHSAGTVMLLNAEPESVEFSENFTALIHNGSLGSYGKASEYAAEVKFNVAFMENFARKTYKGFLTDDELDQLVGGRDFWMDAHEFKVRLQKRNKLFAEEEN